MKKNQNDNREKQNHRVREVLGILKTDSVTLNHLIKAGTRGTF